MEFNARRIVLFGLMFTLLAGVITVSVFATPFGGFARTGHYGNRSTNGTDNALRNDMMTALDNADYTAYMAALDKQWAAYRAGITQDKFNVMVQHYKDMKNVSLDISDDGRMTYGRYGGMDRGNHAAWNRTGMNDTNTSAVHDAQGKLEQAITSGDYASWKEAVDTLNLNAPSGMPWFSNNMTDKITADNFGTYVNFTKAVHDGDFTDAKQLATTLGIDGYAIPMMPIGRGAGPAGMLGFEGQNMGGQPHHRMR